MGVLCLVLVLLFSTLCPSTFAFILTGKRELHFRCLPDVLLLLVLCVLLLVPWVGLQFVIVVFLFILTCFSHISVIIGPLRDKTCLRVSDKASFKPVSSATETSKKIEISPVVSLHMILSRKRITKALISLSGCAGWSAPVLFTNLRRQVFSRRSPYDMHCVHY